MSRDMTGSVQPTFSDSDACQQLAAIAQPLLDSASLLTLVMLVAEAPAGAAASDLDDAKGGMDEVERLLSLCLRRADSVLRYSEQICAAILFNTETKGAWCALDRFRGRLESLSEWALPLQVGLACAPGEASSLSELLALAMKPRARICAAGGQWSVLPLLPEITKHPSLEGLPRAEEQPLRPEDLLLPFASRQATRAITEPGILRGEAPRRMKVEVMAQHAEMFARARARALGVPYLPPPQHIPSSVRNLLPLEVMRQFQCLPIGRDRNALTVALADPTDRGTLHQLEELTGLAIFPVMTDPDALEALARPARPRRASQMAAAPAGGSRQRAYER